MRPSFPNPFEYKFGNIQKYIYICLAEIGEHCLFFVKYFGSIDTEVRYSNVKEDMKKQKAKEKNTYARLFQYYQQ